MDPFTKLNTIRFLMLTMFIMCFSMIMCSDVSAQDKTAKAEYIAAWETYQKSLSTTVTLEKTDSPNIYDYETTLFPYKGKLEILNVVISKDIYYYGDYDLNLDTALKGVVEAKFTNLKKEGIYEAYPYSAKIWHEQNFLFFNEDAGKWLSVEQWREIPMVHNSQEAQQLYPKKSSANKFINLTKDLLPLMFLFIFLGFVMLWANKKQRTQMVKYDITMKRQKDSIDMQIQGFEIAKQSLELQKEQTELLRRLVETKGK